MDKKIENVVFYKFYGENGEMEQACIFYADGTVKNTTVEEGLEIASKNAKENKLTREQLKNTINNKRYHTISGSEFERRFKEFLGKGTSLAVMPEQGLMSVNDSQKNSTYSLVPRERTEIRTARNTAKDKQENIVTPKEDTTYRGQPGERIEIRRPQEERAENVTRVSPVVPPVGNPTKAAETKTNATPVSTSTSSEPTPVRSTNDTGSETIADKKANKANKKTWWQKFKESKFGKRATALLVAAGILLGGVTGWILKGTKAGNIINNNIGIHSQVDDNDREIEPQDVAYLNLLAETKNETLRTLMTRQGENLDIFNRDFANAHLEEGKDIKAALTWDEMMALNIAYNEYTKEEIALMFNGAEVDSKAMLDAYKNGTLQLMGAYVIETRENPVNSEMFVNDPEGRAFVAKYNDLFLKCKETTGEEQIAAINAFYAELHKDFPITDEQRAVGISHADDRATIKPYMLAVVPIVGASEMMFQNIGEIDHTMSDKAIDYFNDIGLCNLAEEKFERAEVITLMAETDKSLPTYDEFRETKIAELVAEGNYVIDDAHRDLSQLSEFQYWVNGFGKDTYYTYTVTSTYTVTTTRTETETYETDDRDEAVERAGEEAVAEAEDEVDKQIEEENDAAKEEAEEEAAKKEDELQEEADKEREELEEEVAEQDKDLEEKIEDANETIDNGGNVNEDDFGDHGVDFDDEHSDENGNLDDSVKDVTTDGTGAVEPGTGLPDPNETGAQFDAQSTASSYSNTASEAPSSTVQPRVESEPTSSTDTYEYEEAYVPEMSNEEIVEAYVASLEGQGAEEETYGHTR